MRGSAGMELGVHLPLMDFGGQELSLGRLTRAVDAARDCGLVAVSANDHLLFQTPWLDGLAALAAAIERSREMELATTTALVALRGPVPLAKMLAAIDLLSGGRVIAGVGPGSSARDYEAIGVPFAERWERFDEAAAILRTLLRGTPPPESRAHYPLPDSQLAPSPLRTGASLSGSGAGARRPVFGGSRASATVGSRPRTTRPLRTSTPRGKRCRTSFKPAAAIVSGFQTRS